MGENHPELVGTSNVVEARMILRDWLAEWHSVKDGGESSKTLRAATMVIASAEVLTRALDAEDHQAAPGKALARLIRHRPESDPAFMTFWEMYGRCGPRKVAWQCWCKAVAGGADREAIINGLEKWVAYWLTPGAASVKWPQGWLNERRWEDEPPTALLSVGRPQARTDTIVARMRSRAAQA